MPVSIWTVLSDNDIMFKAMLTVQEIIMQFPPTM